MKLFSIVLVFSFFTLPSMADSQRAEHIKALKDSYGYKVMLHNALEQAQESASDFNRELFVASKIPYELSTSIEKALAPSKIADYENEDDSSHNLEAPASCWIEAIYDYSFSADNPIFTSNTEAYGYSVYGQISQNVHCIVEVQKSQSLTQEEIMTRFTVELRYDLVKVNDVIKPKFNGLRMSTMK